MNVRGDAGISERADEDGVEVTGESCEAVGWDGGAVFEVTVGSPVEIGEVERRAGSFDNPDCLRDYFLADAVAGNDGDSLAGGHGTQSITNGREPQLATEMA